MVKIYTAIIRPTRNVKAKQIGKNTLDILCERKVLRKIYGPVKENETWRIRTNQEVLDQFNKPGIVREIKSKRQSWLSHIHCMDNK